LLLTAGCSRNIQNQEAVRSAVIEYLSKRSGLDVNAMQVEVTSVNFRGNEADALVSFRAKGSTDPGQTMQMSYMLERQGNQWVVKVRSVGSGGSQMPSGHPPTTQEGAGEVPPGHPPVETPQGETGKK
jgi:hypothetical protein